jgi:hypothetical protein
MVSSIWRSSTWNHFVFLSKKSLIFHDNSCVESMTISMGIIVVLISIHEYLPSMATTRETGCVVMSFVPCA